MEKISEQDRERLKTVLRRMRKAQHGETICLAWWEVDLIFRHIDELKDRNAELWTRNDALQQQASEIVNGRHGFY